MLKTLELSELSDKDRHSVRVLLRIFRLQIGMLHAALGVERPIRLDEPPGPYRDGSDLEAVYTLAFRSDGSTAVWSFDSEPPADLKDHF